VERDQEWSRGAVSSALISRQSGASFPSQTSASCLSQIMEYEYFIAISNSSGRRPAALPKQPNAVAQRPCTPRHTVNVELYHGLTPPNYMT